MRNKGLIKSAFRTVGVAYWNCRFRIVYIVVVLLFRIPHSAFCMVGVT